MKSRTTESRARPRSWVFFRWAPQNVAPTEEVRVVGNCEELGNWEPLQGVPLTRCDAPSECWASKGVSLPLGDPVQYNYVILEKSAGDNVRWEDCEGNRTIVPTGRRLVLEDDGGMYRVITEKEQPKRLTVDTSKEAISKEPAPDTTSNPASEAPLSPKTGKLLLEDDELSAEDVVFIVFRQLPVRVQKAENAEGGWRVVETRTDANPFTTVSLLHKSFKDDSIKDNYKFKVKFVGDPGVQTSDPDEMKHIAELLKPFSCIPVFVDEQVAKNHWEFCTKYLWPLLHNSKVFDTDTNDGKSMQEKHDLMWKHFQALNKLYAETIEAHVTPKSLIWVHTHYLLLVPRYLLLRSPGATIGFFLHSAFPSSEIIRSLPMRDDIMQSLLSCKVVTFQVFSYAFHFLSSCQLLMNAMHTFQGGGILQVEHEGRSVVIAADHVVLPYTQFVQRLDGEQVQVAAQKIREEFGGWKLIASIDRSEPFTGLILKLRAFQHFLSECPQHRHRVALRQHVLVDQRHESDRDLLQELKRIAEEINQKYRAPNDPPVVSIAEGGLDVDARLAVLQAADVLLDTSINDGLNLHPLMFYCAHCQDRKGVVIASEFTGCTSFLTGVIKVNPWKTSQVINAIHLALTMDQAEQESRFAKDHSYVSTQTLQQWVNQNLIELKKTRKVQSCPLRGLGAGNLLLPTGPGFGHLLHEAVLKDYRKAKCRAIFLDNEGTLAADRSSILKPYGAASNTLAKEAQPLDPQVLDCLRTLASDRGNVIVVISGRDQLELDKLFGNVDGLGLCAEYGFYWLQPAKMQRRASTGAGAGAGRWHCMRERLDEDDDWKSIVFELFKQYAKRVQGSIIQNKGSAIVWNYREVGAQLLAREIAMELIRFLDPSGPAGLLDGYPVSVVSGKGYVEVKRCDIDKGKAVARVVQEIKDQFGFLDFILCIGDDRSDEDMFEVVNQLSQTPQASGKRPSSGLTPVSSSGTVCKDTFRKVPSIGTISEDSLSSHPTMEVFKRKVSMTVEDMSFQESKFYTVTVGRKPSKATNYVKDVGEVSDLLMKLAAISVSGKLGRFCSMPSLAAMGPDSEEEEEEDD